MITKKKILHIPALKCPICCENFKNEDYITYLVCNIKHIYHSKCIEIWLTKNDTCPLCKYPVIDLE